MWLFRQPHASVSLTFARIALTKTLMTIASLRIAHRAAVAAAFLFSATGAIAQSAPAATPQSVTVAGQKNASQWFRAESQHFIVYSDTTNDDAYQLLNNLEKLDYLLRIYTKNYNSTSSGAGQKITLYYHDRMASFNDIATGEPKEAVGLYNSCGAGVQGFGVQLEKIVATKDLKLARGPLNDSLSYLFEAYTRHFIYRYTDIRSPTSYIDGFAQYFSSLRFSDTQMTIGRAPTSIARYVYFLDQGRRYNLSFQDVIEPGGKKDVGYTAKSGVRLEFLTKSWLLTHYMLATDDSRAKHDKYLDLVHHDVPAVQAFSQAFGVKPDDIDTLMWRYRVKGVEVKLIDVPSLPTASVEFAMLPQASTDFLLAAATLKSCPDRKQGESVLRTLAQQAAAGPLNELGKLTRARAQIDWGNPQDALPAMTEITRKTPDHFEAVYLLGLANLRIATQRGESAEAPVLQAARAHLARARSLNKKSAEAAFAVHEAQLQAGGKPDAAAMDAAIAAWHNGHEVNLFARSAALALAYSGRGPEADNALTLIAHNERDPEMAKWAKTWQAKLSTGVSRDELVAEMRRQPASPTAFKEWTVATENLMDTVQYNAGIEDARGYLDSMRLADPAAASAAGNAPVSSPVAR